MVKLFDRSAHGEEAAAQLVRLRQGGRSVTEFAIEFKTLATSCGWDDGPCRAMFRAGLVEEIQDEIATHELPCGFDELVNLALRVESRLHLRRQHRAERSPWRFGELTSNTTSVSPLLSSDDPDPCSWDACISLPSRNKNGLPGGLCLYCGKAGHFANKCPLKTRAHQ